jgi:IclR helix-turn-helix domain
MISALWRSTEGTTGFYEDARRAEGMGGLAKGLAIIEAFSVRDAMTVADAARASGASRAAARRCLLTLAEPGYVEQSGREFRPLPRLRGLGMASSKREQFARLAHPILEHGRNERVLCFWNGYLRAVTFEGITIPSSAGRSKVC